MRNQAKLKGTLII